MEQPQLESLKQLLLQQKQDIMNKALGYQGSRLEQTAGNKGDEADIAVSEYSLSLVVTFQERDRLLLQKINRALAKLEDGSFGQCESCGAEMEFKRLTARPVASLCIDCKEEQEVNAKRYA